MVTIRERSRRDRQRGGSGRLPASALLLGLLVVSAVGVAQQHTDAAGEEEARFLSRVRRLTFEGRRAGEGYFSADGRQLVFQSEREPDNPFYQIYLLDLATGDTRRLSPGEGKTTCSFLRPGHDQALFSSTHHDPRTAELAAQEFAARESGRERRYAWDYDPEMDIYVADLESGELMRLTHVRGYDAEASYSPDGEWIVFASNRRAYEEELSERQQRLLEADPATFADLYRMRADGSEVERITDVAGYDGGPFFMPDGERVVWRRFSEDGLTAEVWTADADGSDARQVTAFGAMSWAPYSHPSGDYIVFASNKLGFSNFELYLVDTAGEHEPVRVTTTDGFDGLPVFSPDGKALVWTSNRHGEGGQLYLGEWSDEQARVALASSPPRQTAGGGHAATNDGDGKEQNP